VCGETGSVQLDLGLWFYHRPAKVRAFDGMDQQWKQPFSGQSNAFANQLDDFAESILQNRPTDPDVREGLAAVELLAAVDTSLETGQRVEIRSSLG
jgi:predicted dehydrogenase